MSDTQQGQRRLEDFSKEELLRMVKRGQFVKEQMNQRLTGLLGENLELLAIIQELQTDAAVARDAARGVSNEEVLHPEVLTDVASK